MAVPIKPFRFGVNIRIAAPRAEWIAKARKIEALAYDVLTAPDHLANLIAPIPALASAAEATTRLRVGTLVLNNDFRHPILVAREAAALDLLSDGRLELGLGAGHMKSEYEQAGLVFDPGSTRVDRLAEAVVIIKALLRGEKTTYTGRHYRIGAHTVHPLPVQQPHPPIVIGGSAPRVLALAAKEADVVGLTGIAFRRGGAAPDISAFRGEDVDASVALIRQVAAERFERLELNALVQRVVVTDDRRAAAEALAAERGQLSADDVLGSPYLLLGTIEQIVDDLQARRARWGISYYTIPEPYLDAFAPVVARLTGT